MRLTTAMTVLLLHVGSAAPAGEPAPLRAVARESLVQAHEAQREIMQALAGIQAEYPRPRPQATADRLADRSPDAADGHQQIVPDPLATAEMQLRRLWNRGLAALQHAVTSAASAQPDADNESEQAGPEPPPALLHGIAGIGRIMARLGGSAQVKVAADGEPRDDQPWYWHLPPRARDAIHQSLAEPMPPRYEEAIKRYYQRLSRRTGEDR